MGLYSALLFSAASQTDQTHLGTNYACDVVNINKEATLQCNKALLNVILRGNCCCMLLKRNAQRMFQLTLLEALFHLMLKSIMFQSIDALLLRRVSSTKRNRLCLSFQMDVKSKPGLLKQKQKLKKEVGWAGGHIFHSQSMHQQHTKSILNTHGYQKQLHFAVSNTLIQSTSPT